MEIEFDQAKSEKNRLERDLPFDLVVTFEWDSAVVWPDSRHEYGEMRFCAIGSWCSVVSFGFHNTR